MAVYFAIAGAAFAILAIVVYKRRPANYNTAWLCVIIAVLLLFYAFVEIFRDISRM